MTEEQIPEGFRIVKIKFEEEQREIERELLKIKAEKANTPPWELERQSKTDELISGARAAIIEWLNNPAKVLYWRGSGEGNIDKAPIIAPIIANLKEQYPEQSRRIQENPYLGPLELVVVEAPGLALILTMGGVSRR